jgi:hypothetical protein
MVSWCYWASGFISTQWNAVVEPSLISAYTTAVTMPTRLWILTELHLLVPQIHHYSLNCCHNAHTRPIGAGSFKPHHLIKGRLLFKEKREEGHLQDVSKTRLLSLLNQININILIFQTTENPLKMSLFKKFSRLWSHNAVPNFDIWLTHMLSFNMFPA